MATADSSLLKELECSICADEYCKPVIAGPCNHTFCKHCLQRYIETKAKKGAFPCPLCRQTCTLPPNGIDGLSPNFSIANIIEKYNEVRKQLNQMKWNNCSHCLDSNINVGSPLACPQCDGISLCDACGLRHVNHPMTKSHQVIALCKLHGKPLSKYCKSCGRPICVVCFGKHSNSEDHDVVDYVDLVKGDKAELGEIATAAAPASCQLKKQEEGLRILMTEREKTMVQVKEETVTDFSVEESRIDECHSYHEKRLRYHQSQIQLIQQNMKEDAAKKTRVKENKERCLRKVDKDFRAESEDVTTTIQIVTAMQAQIEEGVTRSDALVYQKLLKADLHDDIVETKTTLQELTYAAAIDRITPFRQSMIPDYGMSKEYKEKMIGADYGLSEEYIAAAGQFSSASECSKFNVHDCADIWSVTCMSRNRIAASYRKTDKSDKLVQWNLPDETEHVLLQDTVCIPYVASLGLNKLVVLRRASPILKVIDVDTKVTRDIDVDIPKKVIDGLWSVELDDRGRFMVTYQDGDKKFHTLLISNDGQLLQDKVVGEFRSTFCRLTGMVTLCTNTADTISCYQVNDDSLTKVMSARHGVGRFECSDICSGSFGEMFVIGRMKGDSPRETRLYQLLLETDKKTVSMKQIVITDSELRATNHPKCSVHGDKLVIGFGDTFHVLQLSV